MKAAWAVAAGALVAVPILSLPARSPAQAEAKPVTEVASADDRSGQGIEVLIDRGNGEKGKLRIGL